MKYLLLIYSSEQTWNALSTDERERVSRDHEALIHELEAGGEYVDGFALGDQSLSTVVRVAHGQVSATDGPYAEVKEHVAGYDVVDVDSRERAVEIAARLPEAALCGIEVRPAMTPEGWEM